MATELGNGAGNEKGGVPSRDMDSVTERQRMTQEGQGGSMKWPSKYFPGTCAYVDSKQFSLRTWRVQVPCKYFQKRKRKEGMTTGVRML